MTATPTLDWRATIDPNRLLPQVPPITSARIETLCDRIAEGLYQGGLAVAALTAGGEHPDLAGLDTSASGVDVVIAHVRQAVRILHADTKLLAELMLTRKAVLWLATQITASVVMGDDSWVDEQVVTGVVHLRESLYDYAAPGSEAAETEGN